MKHYEGELGVFDYDETQFKVFIDGSIRYVGEETDGSKIVIPDGVIDLSDVFNDSNLVTPPRIPKSVVYCNNTFYACDCLIQAAELPEGVLDTSNMYNGCFNLQNAGSIPSTVTNCDKMFADCNRLKGGAIFEPVPECSRWLMYYGCVSMEKAYDIECTKQTKEMYTSCFSLSLSDEQIEELNFVDPMAIAETFPNCTGLLKHYFVPILLSDALDYTLPYYAERLGLTKQEIIQNWILPFAEYGILTGYSVEELMSVNSVNLPDEFKIQNVEDVFQQQFALYQNHNSSNTTTSSISRISEDSTHAKEVNAFL